MKTQPIPSHLHAPICGAFADVVREERLARGLSAYAVAKLAGLSDKMIRLVEARRSIPSLDTAARITDAFALPMSVVMRRAERRF